VEPEAFLCNIDEEFKLFLKYEGNFYTAIVYYVQQFLSRLKYVPQNEAVEISTKTDAVVMNLFK
jgi:hypothetical protein